MSFDLTLRWSVQGDQSVTSSFNEMGSALSQLDNASLNSTERLERINEVAGRSELSFEQLSTEIKTSTSDFSDMDAELIRTTGSFDQLGGSTSSTSSGLNDLSSSATSTGSSMTTAQGSATGLNTELGNTATQAGSAAGATTTLATETDNLSTKTGEAEGKFNKFSGAMANLAGGISGLVGGAVGLYNAYDNMGDAAVAVEKAQLGVDKANTAAESSLLALSKTTSKFAQDQDLAIVGMDRFNAAQQNFNTLVKAGVTSGSEFDAAVDEMRAAQEGLTSSTEAGNQAIDQLGLSLDKTVNAQTKASLATETLANAEENAIQATIEHYLSLVQFAGGIGATVAGIVGMGGAIKNLGGLLRKNKTDTGNLYSEVSRLGKIKGGAVSLITKFGGAIALAGGAIAKAAGTISAIMAPALSALAIPVGLAVLAIGAFTAAIAGIRAHFPVFNDLGVVIGNIFPGARDALNSFRDAFVTMSESVLDGLDWIIGGFDNLAGTNLVQGFRDWRDSLPPVKEESENLIKTLEKQDLVAGELTGETQHLIDTFFGGSEDLKIFVDMNDRIYDSTGKVVEAIRYESNGVKILTKDFIDNGHGAFTLEKGAISAGLAMEQSGTKAEGAGTSIVGLDDNVLKLNQDLKPTVTIMQDGTIQEEKLAQSADTASTSLENEGKAAEGTGIKIEDLSKKTEGEIAAENNLTNIGKTLSDVFGTQLASGYEDVAGKKAQGIDLTAQEQKEYDSLIAELKNYGLSQEEIDKVLAGQVVTTNELTEAILDNKNIVVTAEMANTQLALAFQQGQKDLDTLTGSYDEQKKKIDEYNDTLKKEKTELLNNDPLYRQRAISLGITKDQLENISAEALPGMVTQLENENKAHQDSVGPLLASAKNHGILDEAIAVLAEDGIKGLKVLIDMTNAENDVSGSAKDSAESHFTLGQAIEELNGKKKEDINASEEQHLRNLALIQDFTGGLPKGINLTANASQFLVDQINNEKTAMEGASAANLDKYHDLVKLTGGTFDLTKAQGMSNEEIEKEIKKLEDQAVARGFSQEQIKGEIGAVDEATKALQERNKKIDEEAKALGLQGKMLFFSLDQREKLIEVHKKEKSETDALEMKLIELARARGAGDSAVAMSIPQLENWIAKNKMIPPTVEDITRATNEFLTTKQQEKRDYDLTNIAMQSYINTQLGVSTTGRETNKTLEIMIDTVETVRNAFGKAQENVETWYSGLVTGAAVEDEEIKRLRTLAHTLGVQIPADAELSSAELKNLIEVQLGVGAGAEEARQKMESEWSKVVDAVASSMEKSGEAIDGFVQKMLEDPLVDKMIPVGEIADAGARTRAVIEDVFGENGIGKIIASGLMTGDISGSVEQFDITLDAMAERAGMAPEEMRTALEPLMAVLESGMSDKQKFEYIRNNYSYLMEQINSRIMVGGQVMTETAKTAMDSFAQSMIGVLADGGDITTAFNHFQFMLSKAPEEVKNALSPIATEIAFAMDSGGKVTAEEAQKILGTLVGMGAEAEPLIGAFVKHLTGLNDPKMDPIIAELQEVTAGTADTKTGAETNLPGVPGAMDAANVEMEKSVTQFGNVFGGVMLKVVSVLDQMPPYYSKKFSEASAHMLTHATSLSTTAQTKIGPLIIKLLALWVGYEKNLAKYLSTASTSMATHAGKVALSGGSMNKTFVALNTATGNLTRSTNNLRGPLVGVITSFGNIGKSAASISRILGGTIGSFDKLRAMVVRTERAVESLRRELVDLPNINRSITYTYKTAGTKPVGANAPSDRVLSNTLNVNDEDNTRVATATAGATGSTIGNGERVIVKLLKTHNTFIDGKRYKSELVEDLFDLTEAVR